MAIKEQDELSVDFFADDSTDEAISFIEPEKEKSLVEKITSKFTGKTDTEENEDELSVDFFAEEDSVDLVQSQSDRIESQEDLDVDFFADDKSIDKRPAIYQEAEPKGLLVNLFKALMFVDRPRAGNAGALIETTKQIGRGEIDLEAIKKEYSEGISGEDHEMFSEFFKEKLIQVQENPEDYPNATKIIPVINWALNIPNILLDQLGQQRIDPVRNPLLLIAALIHPKNKEGDPSWALKASLDSLRKYTDSNYAQEQRDRLFNPKTQATDKMAIISGFAVDVLIDPVTYINPIVGIAKKTGKFIIPDLILTQLSKKTGQSKEYLKKILLTTNAGQKLSEAADQVWKMFSTKHGISPELYELQTKFKNLIAAARVKSVRDNIELQERIKQYSRDTKIPVEDINKFITEAIERGGIPNVDFRHLSKDQIKILSENDNLRYEIWSLATKQEEQLFKEITMGVPLQELGKQVLINQADDAGELLLFYFNHAVTPQARKAAIKKQIAEGTTGAAAWKKARYWFNNTHTSILKRREQWKGLTINDINELAMKGTLPGYEGQIFKKGFFYNDVAVAQALRDFKHHKSIAAATLAGELMGVSNPLVYKNAAIEFLQKKKPNDWKKLIAGQSDEDVLRIATESGWKPTTILQGEGFGISPDDLMRLANEAGFLTQTTNKRLTPHSALKFLQQQDDRWKNYKISKNEFTEGYALPEEIVEFVDNTFKYLHNPKEINKFLTYYDGLTRWYKSWTLSIFPGYHARNAAGNAWNNFVMGVNPKTYKDALKYQQGITSGAEGFILIGKEKMSYPKLRDLIEEYGITGRGMFTADIESTLIQEIGQAKWLTLKAENKAIMIGKRVGESIENNARIANFIDGLRKGMTPANAAKRVKKTLFDYSDLTQFEQTVMKRIFPFYTWTRKNVPYQIEMIIKHPGKYKAIDTLRMEIGAAVEDESEDEKFLSTWMLANYPTKLKVGEDGKPRYFMLGGWWAGADVWKLGSQPVKLFTDLLHPILKVTYESTNPDKDGYITDLFTGKTLHPDLDTDYLFGWDGQRLRISETNKHYLNNLRVLNTIDSFINAYYAEKYPDKKRITAFERTPTTIEEALIHFFTGMKTFSIDLKDSKLFAMKSIENEIAKIKQRKTEAIKRKAPAEELAEFDQQIKDLLNKLKGYSGGGLVSQMQRLRFADGGIVSQMQRLSFADGGRVGPNSLIKRVLDYNTVASDEESEAFFNTTERKDKEHYGEMEDNGNKIYINKKLYERKGATGKWKEDAILSEALHNLKHSAPEWYDRLYTAARKDPAVMKWKDDSYKHVTQAMPTRGESRPKEQWWDVSRLDQLIGGYLFAGKDANMPSMRAWSKDDEGFGTIFRKELEAFEKALGRGKKESFMDRGIDYIKSIGEKIDRKGDEIKKDLHWTGFKERSSFLQHMLVDAPIELLKKYVPGIDDKTFEYTEVPPKQESQWTTEYIQSFKEMSIPERKKFLKNLQLNNEQDFEVFRKNLAPSIRDLNKALIHMAAHPVETVDALLDLTAGGIANLLPDNWADTIDDITVSFGFASHKPQQEMASAFGHMIKDEYGSLEKFRESALGNPAQTMFDMWIAGSLAKLGIKTAMKKMPKTVDDITPAMQSKFVTAIQKMELPIERVLDKGVLGVSLHGPKSYIFPQPEGRHLVGKQKEIEALRAEAKNFETAEEFIKSKDAGEYPESQLTAIWERMQGEPKQKKKGSQKKLAQQINENTSMYSHLEETLLNFKQEKNLAGDVLAYFKKNGVSFNELKDTGLYDLIEQRKKNRESITKKELMDALETGRVDRSFDSTTLVKGGIDAKYSFQLTPIADLKIVDWGNFPKNDEGFHTNWGSSGANGRALNAEELEDRILTRTNNIYNDILTTNYAENNSKTMIAAGNKIDIGDTDWTTKKKEQIDVLQKWSEAIYAAKAAATNELIKEGHKGDILYSMHKMAQAEYIEKHLPKKIQEDLYNLSTQMGKDFQEKHPEYKWRLETDEFVYEVFGSEETVLKLKYWDKDSSDGFDENFSARSATSLNEIEVLIQQNERSVGNPSAYAEAQWEKYTLPGKKDNYREIILTMESPTGKPFTDSHWGIDNTVAHLRIDTRTDVQGNKTLFIEEIQSDWIEEGSKHGMQTQGLYKKLEQDVNRTNKNLIDYLKQFDFPEGSPTSFNNPFRWMHTINNNNWKKIGTERWDFHSSIQFSRLKDEYKNEINRLEDAWVDAGSELMNERSKVPLMPMKERDAWMKLGMKRAIQIAVEEGHTRIAWTNALDQIMHWGLGEFTKEKTVNGRKITVKIPEGTFGRMFDNIYDKKMVSYAQQLAKQYNSKVGKIEMDFGKVLNEDGSPMGNYGYTEEGLEVARGVKGLGIGPDGYKRHYLEITPELIEAVKTGRLKFYRRGGLVTKNTYRRGGVVSHNGYRKNMSKLGFQEGGYAR